MNNPIVKLVWNDAKHVLHKCFRFGIKQQLTNWAFISYLERAPWLMECFERADHTVVKAQSHSCIFCMRLRQLVAFLQGDRKFPISLLTQLTAENADHCI